MAKTEKKAQTSKDLCRLITPVFRVSYPHLFKAQAPAGSKPKFSITMLFPKDSDLMGTTVDGKPRSMKKVIRMAKELEFGDKENWPEGLLSPVTDGDDPKHADREGYKGHWAIKASTSEDQRPSVVDKDMSVITDPAVIYPGCYARAYVFAYVWKEVAGKRGVGFILDHVQKMKDGKSFAGKKPIEQVFSPVLDDSEDEEDKDEEADF